MTLYITTSWDDGHALDLRLADLLDHYDLTGTFYITRSYVQPRLTGTQIRELANRHEVGAHTLNHPILTDVAPDVARHEVAQSKRWLEDLTGERVEGFAYPSGVSDASTRQMVADAGYTHARITRGFAVAGSASPYALPVTLQIAPYPLRPVPDVPVYRGWQTRLSPLLQAMRHLSASGISPLALRDEPSLLAACIKWAQAINGDSFIHIWGQSWEIDRYRLWQTLERTLALLSTQPNAKAVTNARLARIFYHNTTS